MNIIKDDIFEENYKEILKYISQDSKVKATKFNNRISNKISKLSNMPFKFRKSYYYEDENIRDLVFKGYTIPYFVDNSKSQIVVLDIFKWKFRKLYRI